MRKTELQTGEKYHYWTVISLSDFVSKKGERYYKCKCDCGTIRDVKAYHLKNGGTKSCGCFVKETMSKIKRIDITGQKFGKLTVIERVPSKKNPNHMNEWRCLCDCGNEVITSTGTLRRGKHKSCGCIRKGDENHNWKGGKITTKLGYVKKYAPEHPNHVIGYVLEHRLVMEEVIGRYLEPNEEVHHKNGIRNDNSKENLELWVKSQPSGQRVEDMIDFCYNFLKKYKPTILK